MDGHEARSTDTRHRLLEAAGEVFAAEGFQRATIQAICLRARANIAAAHYHFGDKQKLYAAVLEYSDRCATEQHPPADDDAAQNGHGRTTPQQRLRAHVESFLARLLDRGRPAWHANLLAREMIEPTPMLDRMVREKIRANHERLAGIVRALLGPDASTETVRLCVLSIVGQCLFYRNSAQVISRLYPDLVPTKEVRRLADHVVRFSLAALRGLRAKKENGR